MCEICQAVQIVNISISLPVAYFLCAPAIRVKWSNALKKTNIFWHTKSAKKKPKTRDFISAQWFMTRVWAGQRLIAPEPVHFSSYMYYMYYIPCARRWSITLVKCSLAWRRWHQNEGKLMNDHNKLGASYNEWTKANLIRIVKTIVDIYTYISSYDTRWHL